MLGEKHGKGKRRTEQLARSREAAKMAKAGEEKQRQKAHAKARRRKLSRRKAKARKSKGEVHENGIEMVWQS